MLNRHYKNTVLKPIAKSILYDFLKALTIKDNFGNFLKSTRFKIQQITFLQGHNIEIKFIHKTPLLTSVEKTIIVNTYDNKAVMIYATEKDTVTATLQDIHYMFNTIYLRDFFYKILRNE